MSENKNRIFEDLMDCCFRKCKIQNKCVGAFILFVYSSINSTTKKLHKKSVIGTRNLNVQTVAEKTQNQTAFLSSFMVKSVLLVQYRHFLTLHILF